MRLLQGNQKKKRELARVLGGSVGVVILLLVLAFIALRAWGARPAGTIPGAHIQTIADIPLSGGTSRFDYQSLDQHAGRLFIAHLGASIVSVFDTKTRKIVANIAGIARVHGVLVIPELGRVYASATDTNQVAVIDEHTLHRIATISLGGEAGNTQYDPISRRIFVDVQTRNQLLAIDPATNQIVAHYALPGCEHDHSLLLDEAARLAFVACDGNNVLLVIDMAHNMQILEAATVGETPDVLAFDTQRHLLYVACESGVVSLFEEQGHHMRKIGDQFVAPSAHSIAVDQQTHQVYLPLEDVGGKPVLRLLQWNLASLSAHTSRARTTWSNNQENSGRDV